MTKKPTAEQLYKTLMLKFIESETIPPCEGYTEVFYPDGVEWQIKNRANEAKIICNLCPFKAECLEYALAAREIYGVWGGLTPDERAVLLKASAAVTPK
jgi:hypothetical protein